MWVGCRFHSSPMSLYMKWGVVTDLTSSLLTSLALASLRLPEGLGPDLSRVMTWCLDVSSSGWSAGSSS
ncbi:hypothetical protein CEXT_186911 [Caerostris extrusa]|uniref:Uncharacterized protein n=1 Tax=Caerostris extrusa TaxID=172846 RepID=A0AAV4X5W6_CAEEX|nr:hypothetical protein CEXT_186911 [Caerostris extrusa]